MKPRGVQYISIEKYSRRFRSVIMKSDMHEIRRAFITAAFGGNDYFWSSLDGYMYVPENFM